MVVSSRLKVCHCEAKVRLWARLSLRAKRGNPAFDFKTGPHKSWIATAKRFAASQ
jgi:hypothetical protein